MTDTRRDLERKIRIGIPISAQMDFRILSLEECAIEVSGGAADNVNVHGTAFAGSLYAICTLAAWGLVRSRLPAKAALVLAEGKIKYRAPVHGAIYAKCKVDTAVMADLLAKLADKGKSTIELQVTVPGSRGAAVVFEATLHASLK